MTNQILPSERFPDTGQNPANSELRAGAELSLTGDAAHHVIFRRLQGHPAAQVLLREVYDFYGNDLSYIESNDFTSNLYAIHLHHDPAALKSAVIQLQLGTNRTVEALTHELLHLHLPMLGFPLGELTEIPILLDHYARELIGMLNWVVNAVHHEIIFQKFVTLGFHKEFFLSENVTPMGYLKLFESKSQERHPREINFSRWCIEYVRHLFSARHGGGRDYLRYAQDSLNWGSRIHPELKQTAANIDQWVEAGVFKNPDHYPRQVNLLLELMRIPKYTGWVTLKRSKYGKTIAVRSDTQDGLRGEIQAP